MGRVLSGIQPTGNLHLGNYLGAIKNWVGVQHTHECLYMLADLHAITVPQEPAKLRAATRESAASLIACGIDPKKSAIFHQSAVPEHSELAWVLDCNTPLGWLNRMTQFKEKMRFTGVDASGQAQKVGISLSYAKHDEAGNTLLSAHEVNCIKIFLDAIEEDEDKKEGARLGLYAYPVLMAADILIYKATHVPVGADQKQHLELARDIAGAFNRAYNQEFFPLPEPLILGEATRVMSLRDGTKKMSKSEESDQSRINLTDDADTIAAKFKKAKTDMEPGITYDEEKRPEVANLLRIFAALSERPRAEIEAEFASSGFGQFKPALADLAIEKLAPITAEMRRLMADPGYIDDVLRDGATRARAIATSHMNEVKDIVGMLRV